MIPSSTCWAAGPCWTSLRHPVQFEREATRRSDSTQPEAGSKSLEILRLDELHCKAANGEPASYFQKIGRFDRAKYYHCASEDNEPRGTHWLRLRTSAMTSPAAVAHVKVHQVGPYKGSHTVSRHLVPNLIEKCILPYVVHSKRSKYLKTHLNGPWRTLIVAHA